MSKANVHKKKPGVIQSGAEARYRAGCNQQPNPAAHEEFKTDVARRVKAKCNKKLDRKFLKQAALGGLPENTVEQTPNRRCGFCGDGCVCHHGYCPVCQICLYCYFGED